MIPANQRYEARYAQTSKSGTYYTTKPVVAWDDDGNALVADSKTGRLREANSWSNFHDLVASDPRVVGIIPGGGWRVAFRQDDGTEHSYELLAWTVDETGAIAPIDVDYSTGGGDDATSIGNFARVIPPEDQS